MSWSKSSCRRRLADGVSASGAPLPEQPVVDEDEVGAELGRPLEELGAGRDAGHDRADLLRTGYLQSVGSVVLKRRGREQLVEVGEDVVEHRDERYSSAAVAGPPARMPARAAVSSSGGIGESCLPWQSSPGPRIERRTISIWSRRVRAGDDRAFEILFLRYQPRIAAYVGGMVRDHGRAEDITQEVFMSALRRLRDDDEREILFRPWIYEIAKNKCIDAYRRGRNTNEVSFDAHDADRRRRARPARRARRDARRRRRGQARVRQPARRVRRPLAGRTTTSSSCASSRASPTARSASASA